MTINVNLEGSSQQAKEDAINRRNGQGPKHLKFFLLVILTFGSYHGTPIWNLIGPFQHLKPCQLLTIKLERCYRNLLIVRNGVYQKETLYNHWMTSSVENIGISTVMWGWGCNTENSWREATLDWEFDPSEQSDCEVVASPLWCSKDKIESSACSTFTNRSLCPWKSVCNASKVWLTLRNCVEWFIRTSIMRFTFACMSFIRVFSAMMGQWKHHWNNPVKPIPILENREQRTNWKCLFQWRNRPPLSIGKFQKFQQNLKETKQVVPIICSR